MNFSVKKRLESFKYAINGLKTLLITQHNAWIHLVTTILVITFSLFYKLRTDDWVSIIIVISTVWIAEALNTSMEFLSDAAVPEIHPLIEKAKDVAAGAVFISAITAFVVGIIIFSKYLH